MVPQIFLCDCGQVTLPGKLVLLSMSVFDHILVTRDLWARQIRIQSLS